MNPKVGYFSGEHGDVKQCAVILHKSVLVACYVGKLRSGWVLEDTVQIPFAGRVPFMGPVHGLQVQTK